MSGKGLVLLLAALLAPRPGAGTERSPRQLLPEAETRLEEGRPEEACRLWTEMISATGVAGTGEDGQIAAALAIFRLDEWQDWCDLRPALPHLARLAGEFRLTGHDGWRLADLLANCRSRYPEAQFATIDMQSLPASGTRRFPLWAPVTALFSPLPAPEEILHGPEENLLGMVVERVWNLELHQPLRTHLRLELPNPARLLIDGVEALVVPPDREAGIPLRHYLSLRFEAGGHRLTLVEATSNSPMVATVEWLPESALATVPVAPEAVSGWSRLPEARAGWPAAAGWSALAQGRRIPDEALAAEPADAAQLHLLLTAAGQGDERVPSREDLLATHAAAGCLAAVELGRRALADDQPARALKVADGLDPQCRESLPGLLLQADCAEAMQWRALQLELLEQAALAFPGSCPVADRLADARPDASTSTTQTAVSCPTAGRSTRGARGQPTAAPPEPSPDRFVAELSGRPRGERLRLLVRLADRLSQPEWRAVAEELMAANSPTAWELIDELLARHQEEEAARLAELAYQAPNPTGILRLQAGKLVRWQRLDPWLLDIEEAVDDYLDSGFAAASPQVVVLDEAVAAPGTNGWLTLVQTTVVHLASPDSAESVGELSLAPEEEIVLLGVRRADGRWAGMAGEDREHYRETISLPGLAAGDIIVRRTVRELPPPPLLGGCRQLPPFYFAHREHPVFRARYVLVPGETSWQLISRGVTPVPSQDGEQLFELYELSPQPAEPGSPQSEAGLALVHPQPECLGWAALRDRISDRLLGACNLPPRLGGERRSPEAIYRELVTTVADDGSGLLESSAREAVAQGQGNLPLALHCALLQEGYEALLVAVNSTAAEPLDYLRPGLNYFPHSVVRVAGTPDLWFDPYDQLAPPGSLRPTLRGRPGLVLSPHYPRLFVSTPSEGEGWDRWEVELAGEVRAGGRLTGRLMVRGRGVAAVDLDRSLRGATDESQTQAAQAFLARVVPLARVDGSTYRIEEGEAEFEIRLSGQIDLPRGGRMVLLLPPLPPAELAQLPSRRSPLHYGGSIPTAIRLKLTAEDRMELAQNAFSESFDGDFGRLALSVEASGDGVEISKESAFPPLVVPPDRYPAFVEFVAAARRLAIINIKVTDGALR